MKHKDNYLFDNPKNVQRLLRVFYFCCAVLVGLELVVHRHTEHAWEGLFGFYPLYGFVGCVVLVVVAKWMRVLLMRPEDYYQASTDDADKDNANQRAVDVEQGRAQP
ncbi:hypothetical protein AWR36_003885 [Microbulbifer flavimaris]|uniref:Solute:sodium symporter small subunit n=1 Tax=Microbulbifer flavimaris TaxID=1781068 RepID=A0ABX4I396_9GAMM|nr:MULTISPECIES: hypothetical protein [Microbulbifer]KUJ84796.1 hypothetical protein AVO43_03885 [Microbulbifer sp. ZGT114]PCO06892.1 hypothetical protein AWR36_003885 [Microbulbifer flavimaris]